MGSSGARLVLAWTRTPVAPRVRLAVWLGLLVLAACDRPPRLDSVVMVTIDTLRADHLGSYGYGRPTSPQIDAIAREGAVFEAAMATCPATAPSVASLLTGAHRASHRVMANGWELPQGTVTLATMLEAHGLKTIGRVANPVLEAKLGFGQGFDDFALPAALERSGPGQFGGAALVEEAGRLLAGIGRAPFFLWLHFMDPHGPYWPPAEYRAMFPAAEARWPGERELPLGATEYGLSVIPAYQAVEGRTDPADYRARYDAELRYVDAHVGAIVALLRHHGLWDRVAFVLTADHGESLGEHDYFFQHGWYAYDDCLRVPLVVRAPGRVAAGVRVPQTVSLIDVAPTILDLLGFSPDGALEGQSLLSLLRGAGADRAAFAQSYYGDGLVALREGPHKYVYKPPRDPARRQGKSDPPLPPEMREEFYDLRTDPGERHDLAASRPEEVRALRARVEQWLGAQHARAGARVAQRPGHGDKPPTRVLGDPQLERQLRALGYVE